MDSLELDPQQALEELDNVISQVNLTRVQHAHLIKCRTTILAALNQRVELLAAQNGAKTDGDHAEAGADRPGLSRV